MRDFIKENAKKNFKVGGIFVAIKDPLPKEVSLRAAVIKAFKLIPSHLARGIDAIYAGQFKDLADRNLNAKYRENAIYITNEQDNEGDIIDDLVHETAHSVEEMRNEEIYADNQIAREFIGKRRRLRSILSSNGYTNADHFNFEKTTYDPEFDNFLYKEVGYESLTYLTVGLVYSPYGMTSLREYFANGFEAYFLHRDIPRLKF